MECKRLVTIILLCSIVSLKVYSQNKTDTSIVKFTFDNEAQLYHQGYKETGVHIDNVSNIWGSRVFPQSENVTDNPLFHCTFYSLIKGETSVYDKYLLDLDLLIEHRGVSYGLYDMNNVVIFPYYKFIIPENVNVLGDKLSILFQTGSFRNSKIHKGLKIYNIDYQGSNFTVNWRRFFFQYHQIGDLSFGIGLRLDELYDYSIGFKVVDKSDKNLNFGLNYSINHYAPGTSDSIIFKPLGLAKNINGGYYYSNYGVWGEYTVKEKARVYFQYEVRHTPYINISENSALLVGGEMKLNCPKLSLTLNPEFRYYGWMYNYAHREESVSYRKNPADTLKYYSNTVGRYLYPLMNYNNNFSQWAVYTDYQYQNIAGIELRANLIRQLYRNIDIELGSESCTLIKEYKYKGNKTFTYLFYSAQLVYNTGNLFKVGFGLNNKAMNLDKHFQTFYMTKKPLIHFFIRKELKRK